MKFGMTDGGRFDPHEQFAGVRWLEVDVLDQQWRAHSAQDGGPHGLPAHLGLSKPGTRSSGPRLVILTQTSSCRSAVCRRR
jgi:hypothetical protein